MLKKFDLVYSNLFDKMSSPFVWAMTEKMPQTVGLILAMLMMASCRQSVPYSYTTEQSVQFIDTATINGNSISGLPQSSFKSPAEQNDTVEMAETAEEYGQRAIDSVKRVTAKRFAELPPIPPISEVIDTLVKEPKRIKSPAERAAIAERNPKGLPAESQVGTKKISPHIETSVGVKKAVKTKQLYDCGCLDKVAIQPNTTPTSFVAVMKSKYPKMTVQSLVDMNKPNIVKSWKKGIFICLKRDKK